MEMDAALGTKVIVIGCGIAGPVLATFLKLKGYEPVLFERLNGVSEAGISLMLQPNGLKVLSLIPGLIERLPGQPIDRLLFYSLVCNGVLGTVDGMSEALQEQYGHGMIGVQRTAFHRVLVETAEKYGVPVHWSHQLEGIEEDEDAAQVRVRFTNGREYRASFVVGCDGLHSNTRIELFGKENPTYTGVVQIGGYSPTPAVLREKATMANIFNVSNHMITYPISATHSAWAISSAEPEAKESWRALDEDKKNAVKSGPWSEWAHGAGELVKSAEKITEYGLYDRPQLRTWHKGRVVLLGDAAHPTTPHLGQGANQAFEDVYHLVRALTAHHADPSTPPSNIELDAAFAEYERVRIPRSAALVAGARARGETRVVGGGVQAARARDEAVKQAFGERGAMMGEFDAIASEPYQGASEVLLV